MNNSKFFALGAALLLAACGSSSGGSDDEVAFSELQTRISDFESVAGFDVDGELDGLADSFTANENVPTSGSASYTGVAVFGQFEDSIDADDQFVAIGSTTMTAEFGNLTSISGTADNFFEIDTTAEIEDFDDATGTSIDGSMTYSFDQVLAGQNGFSGDVSGSLTATDGAEFNFDLAASGGFVGDNAEGFIGAAEASVLDTNTTVIIATTED